MDIFRKGNTIHDKVDRSPSILQILESAAGKGDVVRLPLPATSLDCGANVLPHADIEGPGAAGPAGVQRDSDPEVGAMTLRFHRGRPRPGARWRRSTGMTTTEAQAKTIDGRARTVRELLDKAKYAIDFYQREYAWQERQVRELIDDLTGKFLDSYESGHSRHEVEGYGHYFLGSIVISHKRGQRFVVDGQQRLTTLTLLLIHLHHLQDDRDERVEVQTLVYSEKFGRKSFNLDVPDRVEVMQQLMDGETIDPNGTSESVRNIAARYANIADHLPEEATGVALPFFIDWLLENVHLVEIEAYSDEDAYTIFETMNDRGLSLSLPEMLKGYVLANVRHEDDQRKVNTTWKQHMQTLKGLGDDEDVGLLQELAPRSSRRDDPSGAEGSREQGL